MENKQINTRLIVMIVIFVMLALFGGIFLALLNLGYLKFDNDKFENSNFENVIDNEITQEKLEKIVEDELFVLFKRNIKSLEDIDNNGRLLVALSSLKSEYITSDNDISTELVNFSTSKLEEALANSCLSNLKIEHEDFDLYTLSDSGDMYNRDTNLLVYSKSSSKFVNRIAQKTAGFSKENNQYKLSIKYIFAGSFEPLDGYGSIEDYINKIDSVVKIYGGSNSERIDVQKYLDENYETIKNKLDTYNYIFETQDNKIVLVDFYID